MRLLSAQITGYRSFGRTVKVSFEPGLNCLVGPGGCGKTSFLEALFWGFGVSTTDSAPGDLLFQGAESLASAKGMLIELRLAETPLQKEDLSISRFSARDQSLSHYRIGDVTHEGGVLPDDYAEMVERVLWIPDSSSLELLALDPPKEKVLIFDELDRDLSQEDFQRYYDAILKLRDFNQIILSSDYKRVMELAEQLIGVTMEEYGISEIVSMRITGSEN